MTEQNNNDELPTGTRLEEFEIEQVLGRGGFGVVYLAIDHTLGQRRAIKEFLPGLVAERGRDGVQVTARSRSGSAEYRLAYQQGLNRFLDEARILARLDHPHIVRVYRVLEANGTAYLVMPYYEGKALATELEEGRPEPARVQRVLEQLLDGLRTVHDAGLLHRDLKPDNIYLVDGERPVLLDFGAARRVVVEGSRSSSNNAYTSGYAAIEQYGGSGGEIKEGPWTDLYGLGATIYEWITGNKPWAAPDRVLDDRLKPLNEIRPAGYSQRWLACVDKALALKPRDRHQSIEEWQAALGGKGKSIDSESGSSGASHGWLLPAAMVLGVAVAGGGYLQWQDHETAPQAQEQVAPAIFDDSVPIPRPKTQVDKHAKDVKQTIKLLADYLIDTDQKWVSYDQDKKYFYTKSRDDILSVINHDNVFYYTGRSQTLIHDLCSIGKIADYQAGYYGYKGQIGQGLIEGSDTVWDKWGIYLSFTGKITTNTGYTSTLSYIAFVNPYYKSDQYINDESKQQIKKALLSDPKQRAPDFWKALQMLIKMECE